MAHEVKWWIKTDLFASYEVKSRAGTTRLSLGVNNLLDRQPPLIYTGPAANAARNPLPPTASAAANAVKATPSAYNDS